MKTSLRVRSFTRSVMGLIVTNKRNVAFLNRRDEYYKGYWVDKYLSGGVELIGEIERNVKKDAVELLLKAGLSSYLGSKLTEYIQNEQAMDRA